MSKTMLSELKFACGTNVSQVLLGRNIYHYSKHHPIEEPHQELFSGIFSSDKVTFVAAMYNAHVPKWIPLDECYTTLALANQAKGEYLISLGKKLINK